MINFTDVHKTYKSKSGEVEALKGITFEIEDGEFVFIIGKSGSGKSTLMKCITCEETPNSGDVCIDDFSIAKMPRALVPVLRRHIGMVYQDFRLIESKTVFENIAFAGEIVGIPKKNLNQIVQYMLNLVGLKDKADAYPNELSGGEQQRIAIARAMVNNPKIMVADEPTGNLDPETSENIMAILLEINRSGTTVVVCTHDSNLVDRMKKRVIEIEDGLIIRDKKDSKYTEDVKPEPPVPAASDYEMNIAFGDDPAFNHDREYSDYLEDDYSEPLVEEEAFFFGDNPNPVPAAIPAPATAPAPSLAAPAPVMEVPAEVALIKAPSEDEAEETIIIPAAEEVEEIPVTEEVQEPQVMVTFGDAEEVIADARETSEESAATDINNENWIEEIRLEDSDIDLDIQEDDE